PKRKTRASVAREKGLAPLAEQILAQAAADDPFAIAQSYIDAEKGVADAQEAIDGARDIIAEMISDDADVRKRIRNLVWTNGTIRSAAEGDGADSVYAAYGDYAEPVAKIPPHRILALDRGEKEGKLKVGIATDEARPLAVLHRLFLKNDSPCARIVAEAADDAYARLIYPSAERETRTELTKAAAEQAISVFGLNLRQLLMQPPVRGKTVIGLDPGYRTGCKTAVVDPTGKVLDTTVLYPTHSADQVEKSKAKLRALIEKYDADVLAIGNGTASKETELFAVDVLHECKRSAAYMVVSEAGASVYSASKLAADELPALDLTLRSAVSIARRLQDPLAELVKIEPKAIGVGQYQHDMPQKRLEETLDGVVEGCVNSVGVDLNTASPALLAHIAGLNAAVAKNIVAYREEHGAFASRAELKKVPRLGPKAYEQCAGFLRVPESKNPLDRTAVHPESYKAAEALLARCGFTATDAAKGKLDGLTAKVDEIGSAALAAELGIGEPTLADIVAELVRPGRDVRDALPPPMLRTDVLDMKDLTEGMVLKGTVRNLTDFGAFVDIGVHQDGLVHVSQICNRFIKHPSEVLKVGDIVDVRVLSCDVKKARISLSMKGIR
ncbi:MAG: RNA-binding transcriptional accessory protein, partial [Clostridia bacterium]|nr:RNA-binding transcriptional accessory protein [Clostridia bacterium]